MRARIGIKKLFAFLRNVINVRSGMFVNCVWALLSTSTAIIIHKLVPRSCDRSREVEENSFGGGESISLPGFDIEQELIKTIRTWNIFVRSTKELWHLIFTQIKMEPVVLRVMKGNRFWLLPAVNLPLLFPSTLIVMQCDKKLLFAPHARDSKLKCKNILNCKFTARSGARDFFCGDAVWAEFLSFSYKRLINFANFVSHRKDDKVLKMETKLG